jgi:hypothetical protein
MKSGVYEISRIFEQPTQIYTRFCVRNPRCGMGKVVYKQGVVSHLTHRMAGYGIQSGMSRINIPHKEV